jgi:hypothetical protein
MQQQENNAKLAAQNEQHTLVITGTFTVDFKATAIPFLQAKHGFNRLQAIKHLAYFHCEHLSDSHKGLKITHSIVTSKKNKSHE